LRWRFPVRAFADAVVRHDLRGAAGSDRSGRRARCRRRPSGWRRAGRDAAAVRPGRDQERADERWRVQGASHHHGRDDTLLYEIPKKELDKDFLINSQIKRNAAGSGGYGGQQIGTRVVRWSMKGDRVLLLNMDYSMMADHRMRC
jgi:hypothetical protein